MHLKRVTFTVYRLYFRRALKREHDNLNQTGLWSESKTQIRNPGKISERVHVRTMCPVVVLVL